MNTLKKGFTMAQEKNFENRIKDFLKRQGCWFVKYWGGGQYTKKGVPDILACCNGRFLGIEVKAEKGRASPLQHYNLTQIDKAGGYGILLFPDQYELFRHFISCIKDGDEHAMSNDYILLKSRWTE